MGTWATSGARPMKMVTSRRQALSFSVTFLLFHSIRPAAEAIGATRSAVERQVSARSQRVSSAENLFDKAKTSELSRHANTRRQKLSRLGCVEDQCVNQLLARRGALQSTAVLELCR